MMRSGFSRRDLIVVLVVAVTLLGLFVVYLPQVRLNAFRVQCANNLKRIGEGIVHFHGAKGGDKALGFLPASRIADGYATWPVQIAPLMERDNPFTAWDEQKRFRDQPEEARKVVLPWLFCPARGRKVFTGGDDEFPGAFSDYACVAGNGDPERDWTGPNANGALILGEVLEKKGDLIVRWRGRTSFADLEKRGLSYTFMVGDKHVPLGQFGLLAAGDGSIYDGRHPANFSRVAGPNYRLAPTPDAPFNSNFGSAHPGVCQFLLADGSVKDYVVDLSDQVLSAFASRGD